jgi:hypothetical protein
MNFDPPLKCVSSQLNNNSGMIMWFGKTVADVPEEPAGSSRHVDEYFRTYIRNVGTYLPTTTAWHPRRQYRNCDCCGNRKLRGAWSLSDVTVGEPKVRTYLKWKLFVVDKGL